MAYLTNKRNEYKLIGCDSEILREARIPGLRVWLNGCSGPIDAVAAACKYADVDVRNLPRVVPPELIFDPALREYQQEGVARITQMLKRQGSAILADDMGLGKTREAIHVAKRLPGRKLIVAPAAVRLTWAEELKKNGQIYTCVIDPYFHSKMKRPPKVVTEHGTLVGGYDFRRTEWIITSYDLADKIYDTCFPDGPPICLILDEAHNISGRKSQRFKSLKSIALNCPYRLAITGTPVWDQPNGLFGILDIITCGQFGKMWDFDVRYCAGRLNQWGSMDNTGVSNAEELALRLGYLMVRRTKEQVATELPALSRNVEWLDPVPAASAAWATSCIKPNGQTLATALQATHEAKLQRAIDLAIQARQFLLFTYRREHAQKMAQAITEAGVPCECITGDLTPKARNAVVDIAVSRGIGIVATLDSAGVGVDKLQGVAGYGIFHALDWVPNKLLQAEARLHRIGQKYPVQWTYLAVRESADEHVVRTVVQKLDNYAQIFGQESATKGLRDGMDDSKSEEVERAVMRELYEGLTLE